jgi:ceramide glucosyltransferase
MWLICTALATIGCIYTLLAAACFGAARSTRRRGSYARGASHGGPADRAESRVSILKPLCGAEPGLEENLASFVQQDYPGTFELLFGLQEPGDPAARVVGELMRTQSGPPRRLIVDATMCGPNRKVCNLANLAEKATGEIIIAADSDIKVPPGYLACIVGALEPPEVGLVTCLYRGLPAGGLWSRLSAAAIDHHFLPGVMLALRLGLATPCFGSTIALKRDVLLRIGGFKAFARYLADDYAMGAAVRRLGYAVAVPEMIVDHSCSEASFSELIAHELRWARTIRGVSPWGFAGSAITHPLPFALLGVLCAPGGIAVGVLAASLACRFALQMRADGVLGRSVLRAWWGPLRDLLSFAVYVASFWPGDVQWRGHRRRMGRDGTLR